MRFAFVALGKSMVVRSSAGFRWLQRRMAPFSGRPLSIASGSCGLCSSSLVWGSLVPWEFELGDELLEGFGEVARRLQSSITKTSCRASHMKQALSSR